MVPRQYPDGDWLPPTGCEGEIFVSDHVKISMKLKLATARKKMSFSPCFSLPFPSCSFLLCFLFCGKNRNPIRPAPSLAASHTSVSSQVLRMPCGPGTPLQLPELMDFRTQQSAPSGRKDLQLPLRSQGSVQQGQGSPVLLGQCTVNEALQGWPSLWVVCFHKHLPSTQYKHFLFFSVVSNFPYRNPSTKEWDVKLGAP